MEAWNLSPGLRVTGERQNPVHGWRPEGCSLPQFLRASVTQASSVLPTNIHQVPWGPERHAGAENAKTVAVKENREAEDTGSARAGVSAGSEAHRG